MGLKDSVSDGVMGDLPGNNGAILQQSVLSGKSYLSEAANSDPILTSDIQANASQWINNHLGLKDVQTGEIPQGGKQFGDMLDSGVFGTDSSFAARTLLSKGDKTQNFGGID